MGLREMESHTKKPIRKSDGPLRRSSRIQSQAKPTPGLLAAKKNAQIKMGSSKKQPVFNFVADIYQVARESKDLVRKPTGVVYDNKMIEHKCLWDRNYPECPERLTSVIQRCNELELLGRCHLIEACPTSESELLSLHTPETVELLKSTRDCNDNSHLEMLSSKHDSIYIHPSTYDCSLLAAGSAIKLVEEIYNQNLQNGMAFIRPPGHHAMKSEYCGYCFFNNVALAANHALSLGAKRILIVDWDVHHGQATQQMFYDDPRVVYFSLHRYEFGTFWPNLRESDYDYIGEGDGRGFNFNVPLNVAGLKDADYLAVFHQVLLQMAYEFDPELILISAGFDAALGCPEFNPELIIVSAGYDSALGDVKGEMELTPAVYAHMTAALSALASGKIAVILEGGYCLKSLAEAAALTLRALLGDPCPAIGSMGPACASVQETILNVMYSHREQWKCFRNQSMYSIYDPAAEDEIRHMPIIRYENTEPKLDLYPTRNCYPVHSSEGARRLDAKLNELISNTKLFAPEHKVCFVYDTRMMDHKNYEDKDHMEKPARISSIFKMHEEYGLIKRVHMLKGRSATEEELEYAHSPKHLMEMSSLSKMTSKQLIEKKDVYHSVYLHQDTYKAASLAAGCLLQVVDSVLQGESSSGVAVIRPPGHHADIDDPCGFCIFNSVAVASWYAIKKYNLQRVLIIDWDVHHGNGTQEIFLEDSNVMYMSIHRFDNGEFFPHGGDGAAWHVGRGNGVGFNVNVPWNKANMGNAEYVAAFYRVILPIAYQYDPELVLVSAGFDAAEGDPLGGCKVTPEAFGHFTSWLSPLANGRIILSLEGGYNINSISYSMVMCTKALLGDPLPSLKEGLSPSSSAIESINETITAHRQYWSALSQNKSLPVEDVLNLPPKKSTKNSHNHKNGSGNNNNNSSSKNVLTLVCEGQLMRSLSLSEGDNLQISEGNEEGNKSSDNSGGGPPDNTPSTSISSLGTEASKQQTLTEYLCENMQALVNEEMFAVVPLRSCPHLPTVQPVPDEGIDVNIPCSTCEDGSENWICLQCYKVACGRYVNEHMLQHHVTTEHPLTLSFSDLSVWCYACQAYIDNQVLYSARNCAHLSKFGVELPWSYEPKQ